MIKDIDKTSVGTHHKFAVLVLGHGSKAEHVESELDKITKNVGLRAGLSTTAASLQFSERTITTAIRDLYKEGHRNIVIAPFFLFKGNHILEDIPEWLERERSNYPDLTITMTDPIGSDLRVADALVSRVQKVIESITSQIQMDPSEGSLGLPDPATEFLNKAPEDIEKESFEYVHTLLKPYELTEAEQKIVYRMVHASGDPGIIEEVRMSEDLIPAIRMAVSKKAAIYCDVKMVAAGIDRTLCNRYHLETHVLIDDPEVTKSAKATGQTRAIWAMQKTIESFGNDQILVIGNSPTALLTALRSHFEKGFRPAAIIGTPVGFIGAKESKSLLLSAQVPYITVAGSKGGSAMAAAAFNGALRAI